MKDILPDVIENDSSILIKSPVDFYSKSNNLAIDIVSSNAPKNKYFNKMKALAFHGVDYLMLFYTERESPDILMSYIIDRIPNSVRYTVHIIKKISEIEYRRFAKTNSFRTLGRPSINYGFFVNDVLYYTLSIRHNKSNYEIVNFVRKNGNSSDQAFDELFDVFIKEYNPISIIYFVDRRLDRYDYLLKKGFLIIKLGNPRWYLIKNDTLIRDTNKYIGDKVWDCGTIKLLWKSPIQ